MAEPTGAEQWRHRAISALAGPLAEEKLPSSKGPLFRTAHHEAGHLVAGAVLGRRATEVSVVQEVDAGGKRLRGYVGYSDKLRQADGRLRGGPADRRMALFALWLGLRGIDFRGLRREMRECRARADELLDKHWPAIQAVATELIWRKQLNREEIEALLDGLV
jgi:hypothetical protein